MKLHFPISFALIVAMLAATLMSFAGNTRTAAANSTDLVISGVIDGPLPGGLPKAIEVYVINDIADLSTYGVGGANNGGGSDGEEFTFPAVQASAGEFLYIASETTGLRDFCGFAPDYTSSAASINGDDAIELFHNGAVIDVFGDINVDGSGQPWEYQDGWAYRNNGTGPDGATFVLANWTFSGPNALDGASSNAMASTPFPLGSYSAGGGNGDPTPTPSPTPTPEPSEITLISAIQGSGSASPLEGQTRTIEGIVVGDFQEGDNDETPGLPGYDSDLDGFYVQEEASDSDGDDTTSEGIFVYAPGAINVNEGDVVRVTGVVDEFFSLTELTSVSSIDVRGTAALPTPVDVTLPVASLDEFERYEGMLVRFPQALVISEYFNFDRFGEIVLAEPLDGLSRIFQPTSYINPGQDVDPVANAIERSRITLDDARSSQNPDPARHPNGDEFTLSNRFRGGDTVQYATGVLDYRFSKYRIQPTQGATYTVENPRPAVPNDVGGSLTVASFNVLNYFTTFGSRGADNAEEFTRQRDKIIAALSVIDADIVGLVEIENNTAALQDLVSGLNDAVGAGTYDYIETGAIGTDAIKVAFIYQPATVTPLGDEAVLDDPSFTNPNNLSTPKNRPALAQTFQEDATGGVFTVVVNHFKSKGSGCGAGDDDPQQGSCNDTRTEAARVLVDWLATDPTGSGDPDFMIIGDINAYDEEDPSDAIKLGADDTADTSDDYTDLAELFNGEFAYSFVFDGQFGYLDYALANESLLPQVTGATEWHINADEPDILDYDTSFKKDAQDALYTPKPFRSSDHDPVIVGLNLAVEESSITIVKDATPAAPWLDWTFDGDLGSFTLDNDTRDDTHPASLTFEVSAGVYTIEETNKKGNWDLEIVCTSTRGTSEFITDGTQVAIDLAVGDDVTCTYNNLRRPQIKITTYRDRDTSGSREDGERGKPGWQHFLYIADGQGGYTQIQPRKVRTDARGIANYTSLEPGVDHLVCAEQRNGFVFTEPAEPVIQDGRACQVVSNLAYGEVRGVNFGIQVAALAR